MPPLRPVTDVLTHGAVTFDDVSFSYPGAEEPVLGGISFAVTPGTTTAIIGATGSGNSTLVSLIPRLMDATGGRVLASKPLIEKHDDKPGEMPARAATCRHWQTSGVAPKKQQTCLSHRC